MADDNSNDAKYVCGCDMEEKDPVLCDFIGILDVDTTESVQENWNNCVGTEKFKMRIARHDS